MIYPERPIDFKPRFEIASCYVTNGEKFLMLHRLPHKSQGNKWGVPAGKLDPEENALQAMSRELFEETGIEANQSDFNFFKTVYVRYPDYDFVYHMFSIPITKEVEVKLKPDEHQAYRWMTPQAALEMNLIDDMGECIRDFYKHVY